MILVETYIKLKYFYEKKKNYIFNFVRSLVSIYNKKKKSAPLQCSHTRTRDLALNQTAFKRRDNILLIIICTFCL